MTHSLSKARMRVIEIALAIGGFGIGTGEFAAMGLMPGIAAGMGVTEPQVGHVISAYALGVVVGAPLLAVFGARLFRRHLLIGLMIFYTLANIASALAPDYPTLLLSRFIAGLPHGTYFGVAALVVVNLSPPSDRGKAVSRVLIGLTLAVLIGTPLTTWMGQTLDWRLAFGFVALTSVITAAMLFKVLPLDREQARNSPKKELKAFVQPQVWLTLMVGATGFAGVFCVFSYLAPTLLYTTEVSAGWIPVAIAVFGAGGFVGNLVGGWLFDRFQFNAVAGILLWSLGVFLLFPLAATALWSVLLLIFMVGLIGSMSPVLQTHLMDVAKGAQTLAAASHHAAFNAANALGPFLGGLAISAGMGWTSTGYVGAATALVGLGFFALAKVWPSSEGQIQ
ncbi:MFS transporter [Marinimicrobium alkaliphilum]|uniref:MFS transporter n=1 Tax=Marinimicrobium alkaliphilum TaxID=2202654 RepID=UPI0018E0C2B5|nr:MFS transporter [Marinimicrobium alkaliphilum]